MTLNVGERGARECTTIMEQRDIEPNEFSAAHFLNESIGLANRQRDWFSQGSAIARSTRVMIIDRWRADHRYRINATDTLNIAVTIL